MSSYPPVESLPSETLPPPPPQPDSLPPLPPPPTFTEQPPLEIASAPLKPLLNPLQTDAPPPSSTIVEPPRSPNPANPAISTPTALAPEAVTNGVKELSPLPPNATVPPTPEARDETPPTLPADAIPPAVPTPSVIEVATDPIAAAAQEPTLAAQPIVPAPIPTPVEAPIIPQPTIVEAPIPVPSVIETQPSVIAPQGPLPTQTPIISEAFPTPTNVTFDPPSEPMDIEPTNGMVESSSTGSLKRSGDDLEGREEKRPKEETNGVHPPAPLVEPPVNGNLAAPIPAYVAPLYTPGPPKYAGPTTPLTITQQRHLLSSVRQVKKNKYSQAFLYPVDAVALGLPHYINIITKPMDLSTVETKLIASDPKLKDGAKVDLTKGRYGSVSEAVLDVRQIWENTRIFNGPAHLVSLSADALDEQFEKALAKLPAEPAPVYAAPSPVAPSPVSRRPSVSQHAAPVIRRSSTGPDPTRPKREIHPPPSKDLAYDVPGSGRKLKRRNDNQLRWASKVIASFSQVAKLKEPSDPFFYPVDELVRLVPGYADIIKRPIDLNIIKARIDEGEYDDINQVDNDMRIMTANALKFNPPDHVVHTAALQMQQIWEEKFRSCPPKQEARGESEEGAEYVDDESDGEMSAEIANLESKIADDQARLADLKSRQAKKRANKQQRKPKNKPAPKQRKQSMGNGSPNGAAKKGGKKYDEESEDDDEGTITLTQKQELAEKIQVADGDVLTKAIAIIQQTTSLGANNEEIELDIDSLPPKTVMKLYNLVCRPNKKRAPVRTQPKKPRKPVNRKSMNEHEEAERIKRMEQQLQSFEGGRAAYDEGESESSEEESSDEE